MNRTLAWVLGAVLAAAVLAAGAYSLMHRRAPAAPRLVLLYAPCTVNRAYLSPYNPAVSYTPFLDAFAREGVVFTKHHTEEGQSGIAYAALFSGNQAMRHGVYYHPAPLNDAVYTIAEAYRDNGYETFFWADHPMASPELNFGQGVSPENTFWIKRAKWTPPTDSFLQAGDPRFAQILAHLRSDPSYKAFVFTNFTVTHMPYREKHLAAFCAAHPPTCAGQTPEEIQHYSDVFHRSPLGWTNAFAATIWNLNLTEEQVATVVRVAELLYMSNISYLDQLFGDLVHEIRANGLLDESLIAFTTDHGEVIHRDNNPLHWTHGYMLAPEDILIPLIIRSPRLSPGRFESVTRSIDVFPTLAGLSGFQIPAHTSTGVDLAPALIGAERPPTLEAFFHTSLPVPAVLNQFFPIIRTRFPRADPAVMWVAVRDGDLTYKLTGEDGLHFEPHVYDWSADPGETRDLYDPHNEHHTAMVKRLAQYKSALIDGYGYWKAVAEGRLPTERQEELLRSLGYIE